MATVVEDLVVRLGFQTPGAQSATDKIRQVSNAFSNVGNNLRGVGSKIQSFFSGIKNSFKEGWAEGIKKGLKDVEDQGKKTEEQHKKQVSVVDMLRTAYQTLLGLAVVNWFRNQGHELMDIASVLENTASELHTNATTIQELGYAAKSVDLDVGDLTGSLRVLTRQTEAARNGSKEAASKFRELGLSAEDLAKMPVDEQLAATADALLKIEDPSKRAALQMQLFGRSGGKLAALLEQGSEGLAQLREDFRELGGGLSQDAIDKLGESEQALKKLDVSILSLKSGLVLFLGPAVTKAIDWFRSAVQWLAKADKQMHLLQVGGIAGLLYGLTKIGTAIKWLTGLSTMFTAANAAIIGITLLIVALAVILQDLYSGFTGGRSAIFEWIAEWAGIEVVEKTLRSIKNLVTDIGQSINKFGNLKALGEAFGTKNEKTSRADELQANEERAAGLVDQARKLPAGSAERLKLMKQANALNNSNVEDRFGLEAPKTAQGIAGARDFGFDTSHIAPDILDAEASRNSAVSADVVVNVNQSNASPADIAAATKQGTQDGINAAARKLAGASKR